MSYVASRAKAALLGALVADAATMPLHWIYGVDKVAEKIKDGAEPEFFSPPSCPFYNSELNPGHYALGQPSPYGEELYALLSYMVAHNGDFVSGEDFADWLYDWTQKTKGRLNHCSKQFAEQRKNGAKFPACGADDSQANSLVKGLVIAVRYAGLPELPEKVEAAVRTHQNHDLAVQFGLTAAKALEKLILGGSLADLNKNSLEAISENAKADIEFTAKHLEESPFDFLKPLSERVGLPAEKMVYVTSCQLPQSFMMSYLLALTPETTYEEAIRTNIRIGGDNCSRSMLLGGLLAAAGSSIPASWMTKTKDVEKLTEMIDVLVKKREKSS